MIILNTGDRLQMLYLPHPIRRGRTEEQTMGLHLAKYENQEHSCRANALAVTKRSLHWDQKPGEGCCS
jgi:hypothetical protein